MQRFESKQHQRHSHALLLSLLLFLLIVFALLGELSSFSEHTKARQHKALETALTHAITYCYSVEGVYPESLDYLKQEYGLTYNEDLFFVDYRINGSNLMPDITIIEKEDSCERSKHKASYD